MDIELAKRNKRARCTHRIPIDLSEAWRVGNTLQMFFSSVGCRFRDAGYCTMCDYGGYRNLSAQEAVQALIDTLEREEVPINELLLGTCGSILDEQEMSWQVLEAVLRRVNKYPIPTIILETHYTTVCSELLKKIRGCLPEKEIVIELGFESSNPWVLEHSLNKYMDLNELRRTIQCIHDHNMGVVLNVFLGAPFLLPEEQLEDARRSVRWAVENGANRVVIFPANIHPNTLLWELYWRGEYQPVSHWLLVDLLSELDDDLLGNVELSWYGDRQEAGKAINVIPPVACVECKPRLMEFYREFMGNFEVSSRRAAISRLIESKTCKCQSGYNVTKTL